MWHAGGSGGSAGGGDVTLAESAKQPPPAAVRSGRSLAALLGPAFVAAVAYVDPGNFAANLQSGSRFGYLLLWVLVIATVSAGLLQYLSAKLGVVTGASLPELLRDRLSPPARIGFWLQAESVAMATDLAEVVGGAIALNLLFGLPLPLGGVLTGVASLVLLSIQNVRGQQTFERVVTGLLLVVGFGFVAGLFVSPPSPSAAAAGLLPRFAGTDSMMLAAAMFGATVMPHAVYLHSALSRDRFGSTEKGAPRQRLLRATRLDVVLAMVLAGGVNIAMLLFAAGSLRGVPGVDTIDGTHNAMVSQLGPWAGVAFAVALLASGLASTSVGCHAGSVIMQGLLRRGGSPMFRRMVTLAPAVIILASGVEPTAVLVLSQVVLSLGLPFVLIPLVRLTANRRVMGPDVNARSTTAVAVAVTVAIVALNLALIGSLVRL